MLGADSKALFCAVKMNRILMVKQGVIPKHRCCTAFMAKYTPISNQNVQEIDTCTLVVVSVTSTVSGRRTWLVKAFGCRRPIATLFVDPIKAFQVIERRNCAMTRL